jgi:hypothetical protein
MSFQLVNDRGNIIVNSEDDSSSRVYLNFGNYILHRYSNDGAVLPYINCIAHVAGNYRVYNDRIELIPETLAPRDNPVGFTAYGTYTTPVTLNNTTTFTAIPNDYWTTTTSESDRLIQISEEALTEAEKWEKKYNELKADYDILVNNLFEKT